MRRAVKPDRRQFIHRFTPVRSSGRCTVGWYIMIIIACTKNNRLALREKMIGCSQRKPELIKRSNVYCRCQVKHLRGYRAKHAPTTVRPQALR